MPAYLALIDYVLGSVFFDSAGLPGREIEGLGPGRVDATGSPALGAHQKALAASRSDEVFAFGLATFLAGLEATTAAIANSWLRSTTTSTGGTPMAGALTITDPAFWRLPLGDRMAQFAELREIAPFLPRRS